MTAPTLDEMIADLKSLRTSGHAHAIGHLCLAWNRMENILDILLSILSGLDGSQVRAAIVNNADPRDKLRMIVGVGFLTQPDDEWFEDLKTIIDRIDNELRPERNRMVHDQWIATDEGVRRLTRMGKVIKPQARQMAFQSVHEKPIEENEVWELAVTVYAVHGSLLESLNSFVEKRAASLQNKRD